jgi:hypothetical protein
MIRWPNPAPDSARSTSERSKPAARETLSMLRPALSRASARRFPISRALDIEEFIPHIVCGGPSARRRESLDRKV